MIVKQLIAQFKLDSDPKGWKYRVLSNFKVIVTFNEQNQLGIYRLFPDNKLEYFQISSGIDEMGKCDNWEFILSKKENLILCKTEESKNQLVLFTVDISKRQIMNQKRLQIDGTMIWVQGCFQSQFYQLDNDRFYIYSYKKFPQITKTLYSNNVRGFMTTYYEGIQFIKLKFINGPDQYFKLPLKKQSCQLLHYSLQQKNKLFTIRTRDPTKQQTVGYLMPFTLNICRANHQILFFIKETQFNVKGIYNRNYITNNNYDNDLRYAQLRPKQKIIRILHESGGLVARRLLNRFLVINQKTQNQTILVDSTTNRKIFLTEAQQVSVCGNSVLALHNTDAKIYELTQLPLKKIYSFQQ